MRRGQRITLFTLTILLVIADLAITGYNIGMYGKIIEANPLSLLNGGLALIFLANIIMLWILFKGLFMKESSPDWIFFLYAFMISHAVVRLVVVLGNVQIAMADPVMVEEAVKTIDNAQKTVVYFRTAVVPLFLPLFLNIITYALWRREHKPQQKGGKNYDG
jgi:hypothetical protein